MNLETLLGRTITEIRMQNGEGSMQFICADGDRIIFDCDGDCCSETWFSDITGVQALLNQPITLAEQVDLQGSEDGRTRQEYDRFYGFRIFTPKGCADFVYRNSSNGYYGGSCDLFVNGVSQRARYWGSRRLPSINSDAWPLITDDWQA